MELIAVVIVVGVVFGLCYLVDKGFSRLFRNREQHKSGLEVRPNKKYITIGIIVAILGTVAMFSAASQGWGMLVAGGFLLLVGACLIVYYVTFGIFYDEEGFILSRFGRKSVTYAYRDIEAQQLFNSYGNIIIELYTADGKSVQLQSSMTGVYPFMDKAFSGWLRQTGRDRESCDFYDPENSCWFPRAEG